MHPCRGYYFPRSTMKPIQNRSQCRPEARRMQPNWIHGWYVSVGIKLWLKVLYSNPNGLVYWQLEEETWVLYIRRYGLTWLTRRATEDVGKSSKLHKSTEKSWINIRSAMKLWTFYTSTRHLAIESEKCSATVSLTWSKCFTVQVLLRNRSGFKLEDGGVRDVVSIWHYMAMNCKILKLKTYKQL